MEFSGLLAFCSSARLLVVVRQDRQDHGGAWIWPDRQYHRRDCYAFLAGIIFPTLGFSVDGDCFPRDCRHSVSAEPDWTDR